MQMIASNSYALWKHSHRSFPEQITGASIIGLFSIAFGIFEAWFFPQEFTSINFLSFTLFDLKHSHRSFPEQITGASIIGLFSIAFGIFEAWFFPQEFTSINFLSFTLLHAMVAASFWTLWRCHSLRNLKVELSLFFCFILFKTLWSLSYFLLQEPLLSLIALILWLSNGL